MLVLDCLLRVLGGIFILCITFFCGYEFLYFHNFNAFFSNDFSRCVIAVCLIGFMAYALKKIFERLKEKEQGFGPNSLKVIGMTLFMPTLVILSIFTDFKAETLAALLGTVAGYVLSNSTGMDDKSKPESKNNDSASNQ